jgi:uncharacterized protein (DUF433 family)
LLYASHAILPFSLVYDFIAQKIKRAYRLTMLDWSQCAAVERNPAKVSGAWVFKNSRVPVRALFENLEGGASVNDFLEWFPGVAREQVEAVLEFAEASLVVN